MTYPNVLVLNYLQTTGQANPEIQMAAEKYVATGYQRLLTFEVDGGGFSLFGNPPAEVFLTAYGLMEFTDMAKVYPVDQAVIDRTAQWLLNQQQSDGAWLDKGYSEHWQVNSKTAATAYIAWALIDAGYKNTPQVEQAIANIREFALQEEDAYNLALAANALAAYDPQDSMTKAVVDRLYDMRSSGEGTVFWKSQGASFMGATGDSGSLETTALAAMALMKAKTHPDAVSGALAYLIKGKDSWGTWQTTQATILSLKTMLLATEQAGKAEKAATVRVSLNKEQTQEITIDQSNADVVHLVTFDKGFSSSGANRVQIEVDGPSTGSGQANSTGSGQANSTGSGQANSTGSGQANLMYQVATSYYLPWGKVPPTPEVKEAMTINLAYDRTQLAVNDEVTVKVGVNLNPFDGAQGKPSVVKMALVDLGVPPGFTVLTEDLSRLVAQKVIARYELTGRQIIIYLENFSSDQPVRFSYRLRARFPMRAQTPPSSAYDYYNPSGATVQAPLALTVSE